MNLVLGQALGSPLESPILTHPLEQGSANYSLSVKSSLLPVSANGFNRTQP